MTVEQPTTQTGKLERLNEFSITRLNRFDRFDKLNLKCKETLARACTYNVYKKDLSSTYSLARGIIHINVT